MVAEEKWVTSTKQIRFLYLWGDERMFIEKTNKFRIALILILVGWLSNVTLLSSWISLIVMAIGAVLFINCDHIYYKKKKSEIELKLRGTKYKVENVKGVHLEGKTINIEIEGGEKKVFYLKNFSEKDLNKLVELIERCSV